MPHFRHKQGHRVFHCCHRTFCKAATDVIGIDGVSASVSATNSAYKTGIAMRHDSLVICDCSDVLTLANSHRHTILQVTVQISRNKGCHLHSLLFDVRLVKGDQCSLQVEAVHQAAFKLCAMYRVEFYGNFDNAFFSGSPQKSANLGS